VSDQPQACGAPAGTGPCALPPGHNTGQADVPENHRPGRRAILADPLADLIAHTYARQHGFPTGLRGAAPQELVAIIVHDSTVLAGALREHGWVNEEAIRG
jgi:hypothetical protein